MLQSRYNVIALSVDNDSYSFMKYRRCLFPFYQCTYWVEYLEIGIILGVSSDGDDRKSFLGLKFSIPVSFGVEKFGKYFYGWLGMGAGSPTGIL